ncbi:hypothetical protein B0H12DRAFT_1075333 [Mycena haematopus]|nr:hypothetical protein B0H12DRAFT_1075333 [Mycena haematopus]
MQLLNILLFFLVASAVQWFDPASFRIAVAIRGATPVQDLVRGDTSNMNTNLSFVLGPADIPHMSEPCSSAGFLMYLLWFNMQYHAAVVHSADPFTHPQVLCLEVRHLATKGFTRRHDWFARRPQWNFDSISSTSLGCAVVNDYFFYFPFVWDKIDPVNRVPSVHEHRPRYYGGRASTLFIGAEINPYLMDTVMPVRSGDSVVFEDLCLKSDVPRELTEDHGKIYAIVPLHIFLPRLTKPQLRKVSSLHAVKWAARQTVEELRVNLENHLRGGRLKQLTQKPNETGGLNSINPVMRGAMR